MILYTSQGKPLELGAEVGRGGEAVVYRLAGDALRLAKIFDPEPRAYYPQKLAWMVEHPPDNPTAGLNHASLAWPDLLLYDSGRNLKGFCMPFIAQAVPLLEVFNPRRRAAVLPQFDRRYLHRTARNLAAAMDSLHSSGYVAGDVNESNVLVTPSALVTLIDSDSFQVVEKRGGAEILHRCPVAKPEYTPPELQGKPLEEVKRVPDHDAFGLAVLIFQLLMNGSHPFRAQWLGQGDPPPLEKRIADGLFPYMQGHSLLIAPPPNLPGLDTLHPWLNELFQRCFVDGYRSPRWRPSPALWARAIAEAEAALVCCAAGHYYDSHLLSCPYCDLAQKKMAAPATSSAVPRRQPRLAWSKSGQPAVGPVMPLAQGVSAATAPAAKMGPVASGGSPISAAQKQGTFTRLRGAWPACLTGAKVGITSTLSPTGAWWSKIAGLFGRLRIGPGALRAWFRAWVGSSLAVGGGLGAASGMIPGMVVAFICWLASCPPDWGAIIHLGGAAGGLLCGWRPAYRLATQIDKKIGWKRFWEGAALTGGAAGGGALGTLVDRALVPALLGIVLGATIGYLLGSKLWEAGLKIGWDKIWRGVSMLGAAALGWEVSALAGEGGLNKLGAALAGGLQPYAADNAFSSALAWLLTGVLGGALSGAVAGWSVELAGRVTRLSR